MNCCKKNSTPTCDNQSCGGFQSYFFIVLILFILLAIIMGGVTY